MRYFFQLPQNKQHAAIDLWGQVGVEEGTQGTPDQVLRFLRLCEDEELSTFYIENICELMNAGNECSIFDHTRELTRLRQQVRDMAMEKKDGQ